MISRMLMMCSSYQVGSDSSVYVSNTNSDTISTFNRNVSTGALTGSVTNAAGDAPFSICISQDGKNVYVNNQTSYTISIYDRNISTGALTANGNIATGNDPSDICISHDGKNVYVANQTSSFLSIYDRNISTGALTANGTIACDIPQGIAISLDGKNVYASNAFLIVDAPTVIGAISIYDRNISTGALTANGTIYTGITDTNPTKICISFDGVSLYVVNTQTDTIQAYDRNISTGALTPFQSIATQNTPQDICISEDGISIYVVNTNSNTISIYNRNVSTRVLTSGGTIATGIDPFGICISSDKKNVYVCNYGSYTVSIYDRNISTGALSLNGTVSTGTNPTAIAVYPKPTPTPTPTPTPINPYCVSGAGTTSANGSYTFVATPTSFYSYGYWEKIGDTVYTFGYDSNEEWWVIKNNSTYIYGANASGYTVPPSMWSYTYGMGTSPPPYTTSGSC